MATLKKHATRPLSPHLAIYRPTITMMMSIIHRLTGLALYAGTLLLAVWLISAALGDAQFAAVQGFMGSIPGRLILLGYTWALLHHMLGGIRHFIWDMGAGFGPERYFLAWMTLVGSLVLTIAIWIIGYAIR